MVSYGTNITSVAAGRTLTAAVAASENDLGECMEVCKRENARSDDGIHTAATARAAGEAYRLLRRRPTITWHTYNTESMHNGTTSSTQHTILS